MLTSKHAAPRSQVQMLRCGIYLDIDDIDDIDVEAFCNLYFVCVSASRALVEPYNFKGDTAGFATAHHGIALVHYAEHTVRICAGAAYPGRGSTFDLEHLGVCTCHR